MNKKELTDLIFDLVEECLVDMYNEMSTEERTLYDEGRLGDGELVEEQMMKRVIRKGKTVRIKALTPSQKMVKDRARKIPQMKYDRIHNRIVKMKPKEIMNRIKAARKAKVKMRMAVRKRNKANRLRKSYGLKKLATKK